MGNKKQITSFDIAELAGVSLAGFDDIPMASFVNPPLTTVLPDTGLAGEVLVDSLRRLIRGEPVESRMLPMKLIVRSSSLHQTACA